MKQIILMSIQPQHYGNIEALRKTYEIRKNPLPSGTVVHVYLAKKWHKVLEKLFPKLKGKLGKVVAKFIVGKVVSLDKQPNEFLNARLHACISPEELRDYAKGKNLYALEITHLEIFDRPRELGEYKTKQEVCVDYDTKYKIVLLPITHAPQSYMKAWVEE